MALIKLNETYYQIIDSESPNNVTFDKSGSSSVITFLVHQSQLLTFYTDVLGTASLKNNSYVTRTIPASHPIFPWQYAYKLLSIKGYSADGKEQSSELKKLTSYKNIDVETPQYVGSYEYYKVGVNFTSRNYAIYTDDQLKPFQKEVRYSMPVRVNFNGDWGERFDTFTDRFESARYTNIDYMPQVELLNYGGGNYWCKRGEVPVDAGVAGAEFPISNEGGGNINLKVSKVKIDFNWFQVPYELCVNNRIWQDAYSKINLDQFYFFPKGGLIFTEAVVRKYEPFYPFQTIDLTQNSSVYDYFTEYHKNQLADVTFKFILFWLDDGIRFQPSPNIYQPLSCKDINSYHNRIMHPVTKIWYYTESARAIEVNQGGEQVGWKPNLKGTSIYFSYPYSNLFNYVEGP